MKFGRFGSTKAALGLMALALATPFISGCDDSFIDEIRLCGTVVSAGQPMSHKQAQFSVVLAYKDGNLVPLRGDGVTVLDAQGRGCVNFSRPSVDGYHFDFGSSYNFSSTFRLILLSVSTENGIVDGTLVSHNLHSGASLGTLTANASFDYDHPNTEDPGQITRYLLKQLMKLRKKTPASKTSDQMATKTVEPRKSEAARTLRQDVAGTKVL